MYQKSTVIDYDVLISGGRRSVARWRSTASQAQREMEELRLKLFESRREGNKKGQVSDQDNVRSSCAE